MECPDKGYNIGVNNPFYGKKHTEATLLKMRLSKLGVNNPNWQGDNVKYAALHEWVRSHKTQPSLCEECKLNPPYDLANISQEYHRDLDDWRWLCRKCHMISDERLNNLHCIPFEDKNLRRDEKGRYASAVR